MSRAWTINLIGNASKFIKEVEKADKSTDDFAGKMSKAGDKMKAVGAKMTAFATVPIAGIGIAAFKTASDVNESLSKVDAVFGTSAKEIDKWAKGAAKSIGLSRGEALDAAGSFGNMFVQLGIGTKEAAKMSTSITGLAADFASFHNADITQVIDAQSAAFRGEYDSLQRFLPLINAATVEQQALSMTGKAAAKELTAQEKALAVNALMLKGAGDAMGDFARTSGSASNQQRIMTAQVKDAAGALGQQLLPIGEKVLGWAASLAERFGGLSSGTQTAILVIGGLVAGLGPLITMVGSLATAMAFLAANPIVLVIAAIAALAAGLVYAYQKSETFRNIVQGVFSVIKTIIEHHPLVMIGKVVAGQFDTIKSAVQACWDFIRPILDKIGGALGKVAGPLKSVVGAVGGGIGKVGGMLGFDSGGIVPGPVGAARLAVVHGGETILPTHKAGFGGGGGGGNTYQITVQAFDTQDGGQAVVDAIRSFEQSNGSNWRAA